MADIGHQQTDKLLEKLEKRIAKEYAQAAAEVDAKLADYLRRFEIKDEIKRKQLAAGIIDRAEYNRWRTGQIIVGKRWENMRDQLAGDLHEANVKARALVDGQIPSAYVINANYATYQVERLARIDTGFTLYDENTVARILKGQPELLPPPGKRMKASIAAGKDIAWQKGQIQSVTLQSILQGESIPNMSKRIARTMGETNHKSTIRYARTAVTGAQNAGRLDSYHRAQEMGIEMKQRWIATLDNRTRHSHRQVDGETVEVGETFSNGCRYPGDPEADGSQIWNCRCSMRAEVAGLESRSSKLRSHSAIVDQSYEEWLKGHSQPNRITKQEEIAEAMRWRTIHEDYRRKT